MRRIVTRHVSPTQLLPPFFSLQRGLSKLQMLTAVAVIAVVAIVAAPRLLNVVNHAHSPQIVAAEQDIAEIEKGLQLYKQDIGRYPTTEQGLLALIVKPGRAPVPKEWKTGGYLDRLPRDPWGNAYQYQLSEDGNSFDVFSFGAAGPDEGVDQAGVIRGKH
ncbi:MULTISPECIES: type II secretion system major pseudopilin GspG [unclassified Herbaspirillum]|uniref:type II secretion system major pseudopilin GspG n=1 Tax=unclassified Herbaspirillum TaxID=2624150 RepID=UPI00383A4E46